MIAGNGKPLLLLHGNTISSKMFDPIVSLLSEKNTVIRMDFLGCGQSERSAKWPTDLWYSWSEQSAALLRYLGFRRVNVIGVSTYRANKPQNFIAPVPPDSVEMQTVELLAGPDDAHLYKFTTTDEYKSLRIFFYEYRDGELLKNDHLELGFDAIGSPKNGEILIVPDFSNYVVKIVVATDTTKLSTERSILEGVTEREYFGRSSTRIEGKTRILYDIEQHLVGLIYDNDKMRVLDIYDLENGETDSLRENDYVYLFSYEFCKEQ